MSDDLDLRKWFEEWPYDAESDTRLVHGADGREILQVRTPLGIEQYELEGRPDGQRPYGDESVLEHHLARMAKAREAGREDSFRLGHADCVELSAEGVMYYYRYLRLFQLKDWERTVRDTSRNLRLFDFVHRYASREEDRSQLEQWRPYLLRMNAVAKAMLLSDAKRYDEARRIVEGAVTAIEALPLIDNPSFTFERKRSLDVLKDVAAEIEKNRPPSKLEQLERELRKAVEAQEFERAAGLRDEIKALRKSESAS